MAAILNQGKTAIRDQLKTLITYVGVSTDDTAFSATQTAIDPSAAGTNLIKSSSETNVDDYTFDAQITIDGDSEFTDNSINTISILDGSTRTDALTRSVRTQAIGVQAGDSFTIGVRVQVQDNS